MAIPDFDSDGFLPLGLHECTLEEVMERFGRFQESDRRPSLARELAEYVAEVRSAGIGKYLVVDGSFATTKARPGDIDLLLVLRDDVSLSGTVPPFQYNVRSKSYIRNRYNFDFFFGWDGDLTSIEIVSLFARVKERPELSKGSLKVVL
jgi:hypothetical protein